MNIWELIVQQPVINILIVLSHYLLNNFGLAIIALTIIVNLCMLPLTLSQLRSTKALQELQPRLLELQQKFGKDRQRLAHEQMNLYKESGVKPAGCAITMVIQMPVWLALYQSIMLCLAVAPEGLLNLARYLYPWEIVYSVLPLSRGFLLLDLAEPNFILAVLVGASMWLQQKMSTTVMPTDHRQRQQTQMMVWMMPILFAFMALSFPSGLALFWVASTVVRIFMQYRITGWGGFKLGVSKAVTSDKKYLKFAASTEEQPAPEAVADSSTKGEETKKPKDVVIYPEKPSKTRYQPGKDRTQHHPKK